MPWYLAPTDEVYMFNGFEFCAPSFVIQFVSEAFAACIRAIQEKVIFVTCIIFSKLLAAPAAEAHVI